MSKDSEYIDFWLSSSNDSWNIGSPRNSDFEPPTGLFKSRKMLTWHYILASCSFLCISAGIFITIAHPHTLWMAHLGFLVALIFNYPTFGLGNNISKHIQFESDKLEEQTTVCKKAAKFWLIIACIEFVTEILLTYYSYKFAVSDYYDYFCWFTNVASVIAIGTIIIYTFMAHRNVDKLISENPTFQRFNKCKGVDFDMLYMLFDNNRENAKLCFANGSYLISIKQPAQNRHGFTFVDTNGTRKEYIIQEYSPTLRDVIHDGLGKIAQDINNDIALSITRDIREGKHIISKT